MNICVLTHTFPRFKGDPTAPFMGTLAEKLADSSHKVVVLAPFNEKYNFIEKRIYKLITYKYIFPDKFHLLGYSKTLKDGKSVGLMNILLSPFFYFFCFMALLKITKKEKIDIICSHWIIPNGFIAALVSSIIKVPFTTTIPGSDVYMASKNRFFRWMAKIASDRASFVISDSPHYLKQLNNLGIFPKNTKIIRYGVDIKQFNIGKKDKKLFNELGLLKEDKVILGVGRFVSKKGFIYLIRAMQKIVEKNKNIKLILVGDGEDRSVLEKEIIKLNLLDNIILPGMVEHKFLVKYYHLADIFVMPSIKDESGNIDASPVSMMEAMTCGLPVVATNYAADGNLLIEGKTGTLVKEQDSMAIANSVLKIIASHNIKLKLEICKMAVLNFSSEITARSYLHCFKKSIYSYN